jgi:hypothetical protein
MAVCREIIEQLEKAQEHRELLCQKIQLIKTLKQRILGMIAIEKSRARQRSRITWLQKEMKTQSFFSL